MCSFIQEGPNMKLNEEQFFDAVDTALDVEDENDDDLVSIIIIIKYSKIEKIQTSINSSSP